MRYLFILNDPAYGTERSFNGLRLAASTGKREGTETRVFMLGDAVTCAITNQQTPNGYYNLAKMVSVVGRHGEVGCCGACMDARGIADEMLVEPSRRSTLDELTDWTEWADKVLVF